MVSRCCCCFYFVHHVLIQKVKSQRYLRRRTTQGTVLTFEVHHELETEIMPAISNEISYWAVFLCLRFMQNWGRAMALAHII